MVGLHVLTPLWVGAVIWLTLLRELYVCHFHTEVLIARRNSPQHVSFWYSDQHLRQQWPLWSGSLTVCPPTLDLLQISFCCSEPLRIGGCLIQQCLPHPDWQKGYVGSRSQDYKNHRDRVVSCPLTINAKVYYSNCWWLDQNPSLRLEESFRDHQGKLSHLLRKLKQ